VSVVNPATGERIVFREGGADALTFDDFWTRPGHRAPPHIHPEIEERWLVVAGTAAFRIGERELTAAPGDEVVAPPGVEHLAWNPTAEPVHLRVEMRPALRWREFVERLFALPADDTAAMLALVREYPREIALPVSDAGQRR
jgi:quercetin dioxygenase-like cupin family protein